MELQQKLLLGIGILVLIVTWMPQLLRGIPLSLPIVCVAGGWMLERLGFFPSPDVFPFLRSQALEIVAEIVVLVALTGAGLRIDRRFGARSWSSSWRLLGIAMPLTIAAMAALASVVGHYGLASALLVGAALAPTDPVLASDVEVGPPGRGEEGEVRFALTAEAGFNDGLAFPFVSFAIALAAGESVDTHWVLLHFVWKVGLSLLCGWVLGRLFGILVFRLPRTKLSQTGDGLAALAIAFLSFVATEALGGYGFIAVFVMALTLRTVDWKSDFHRAMSDFSAQIERLLAMLLLVLFGVALGAGVLDALTWIDAAIAIALIVVVRPVLAMLAMSGSPHPWPARGAIAFFGIRGIGTLYYLIYAFSRTSFAAPERLVALVSFTVLCSIVVHGLASGPLMQNLDRKRTSRH